MDKKEGLISLPISDLREQWDESDNPNNLGRSKKGNYQGDIAEALEKKVNQELPEKK